MTKKELQKLNSDELANLATELRTKEGGYKYPEVYCLSANTFMIGDCPKYRRHDIIDCIIRAQ